MQKGSLSAIEGAMIASISVFALVMVLLYLLGVLWVWYSVRPVHELASVLAITYYVLGVTLNSTHSLIIQQSFVDIIIIIIIGVLAHRLQ